VNDPIVASVFGPVRLSRLVSYYRNMARSVTWDGKSNRAFYHSRLRQMIADYRERGPLSAMPESLAA
jgi:hypothetical protein